MMTLYVNAPRWVRWPVVCWFARVLRLDQGCAAHGQNPEELYVDLERLCSRLGATLSVKDGRWAIGFPGTDAYLVSVEGLES